MMEKIMKVAQKIWDEDLIFVGVRTLCDDEQYKIGDYCRESYEWNYEYDCSTYDIDGENEETAGGTCATYINVDVDSVEELAQEIKKAIEFNKIYPGSKQAIIAGDGYDTSGVLDDKEIRIKNAYVLELLDKE